MRGRLFAFRVLGPRMSEQLLIVFKGISKNFRDFFPILAIVVIFHWAVVGQPMPELWLRLGGILLTLVALTLVVRGLDKSVLPLGQSLASGAVSRRGMLVLMVIGFAVGFGSTVAEPALAAVAEQAAATAAATGSLAGGEAAMGRFAFVLRYVVAAAVGLVVAAGVLRILNGWPAVRFVLPGYALATIVSLSSESPLAPVAFEAGAAATSAVNLPAMMTLGAGLASLIEARDPLTDGFGLIAAATLMPMMVIQLAAVALGG